VVGVEGSLLDPRGISVILFSWGLGNASNNLENAYALLCGLSLAKEANINSLIVFGDSMVII
jgi:hypothetical protein